MRVVIGTGRIRISRSGWIFRDVIKYNHKKQKNYGGNQINDSKGIKRVSYGAASRWERDRHNSARIAPTTNAKNNPQPMPKPGTMETNFPLAA